MKQIGKVKFFAADKGFGFITCENSDVFVHQSACDKLTLKEGDWVVCTVEPSRKHTGKHTATSVSSIIAEKEYLKSSLHALPELQRKMLFQWHPDIISEVVDNYVTKDIIQQLSAETEQIVRSFDLEKVVASITGGISTSRRKKPGDDDSFSAWIGIGATKTDDAYVDQVMPRYSENTYSDSGFYSCYSMEDDYNRDCRPGDEARLPVLIEDLKQKFRLAYSSEEHYNHLISKKIELFKKEVRHDLYNHGTTELGLITS